MLNKTSETTKSPSLLKEIIRRLESGGLEYCSGPASEFSQ